MPVIKNPCPPGSSSGPSCPCPPSGPGEGSIQGPSGAACNIVAPTPSTSSGWWAIIDSCFTDGKHAWHEVAPVFGGNWTDVAGGRYGTHSFFPAFEYNHNIIHQGIIVWMDNGAPGEAVFSYCCNASCEPGSGSSGSSGSGSYGLIQPPACVCLDPLPRDLYLRVNIQGCSCWNSDITVPLTFTGIEWEGSYDGILSETHCNLSFIARFYCAPAPDGLFLGEPSTNALLLDISFTNSDDRPCYNQGTIQAQYFACSPFCWISSPIFTNGFCSCSGPTVIIKYHVFAPGVSCNQ